MNDKETIPISDDSGVSRPLRELFFELGQALSLRYRYVEASAMFQQALGETGSNPDDGEILLHLAGSQYQAGDHRSAFRSCLEVIAFQPERCDTILPYAHELLTRNTVEIEREWLQHEWMPKIANADLIEAGRADVVFFLGRVKLYIDEYNQALVYFQHAMRVMSDDVRVVEGFGEALWRVGRLEEAIEVLNRARELIEPEKHFERLNIINAKLAQVLADSRQYDAALSFITDVLTNDERFTNVLLLTRSQCYLALGQPERALEAAEAVTARNATDVQAHLLRIQALIALERYKEAVNNANQALQYDPSNSEIPFYKSQALIEGYIDLDQARRLLKHYVERVGSEEAVRQTLLPVFTVRSENGNMHYFLAQLHSTLGNSEAALHEVNRALELGLYDLEAPTQQLKAELLQTTSPIEAAVLFHQAGRSFSNNNGDYKIAIDLLKKAKKLNPDHAPIYWDLSNALFMSGRTLDPPYVDREKLDESQSVWETGIKLLQHRLPDANYSWAYVLRALISESWTRLSADADYNWNLMWEAIAYLERAILLYQKDAIRWAYLGDYHRQLNNEACALENTNRALSYGPTNAMALYQRGAILANMGQFDEAEKVIDEGRKLEPDIWADALKVYLLFHTERTQEALELVNKVVEAAPKEIWYRSLRAICYRIMGDQSSADEDYRWILERYDLSDVTNLHHYGSAAFRLGEIDKALTIYTRLLEDPLREIGNIYWDLGLCYLSKGDLIAGKDNLGRGIKLSVNIRQLSDLIYLDLEDVERFTANEPDEIRSQIRAILDQIKEEIKIQRAQITQERSVEGELKQIIAKLTLQGETDSWPWIASHAGLARFYTENERWSEAAKIYQLLQKQAERFPEARQSLENAADGLRAKGDEYLKASKPDEAIECYQQLRTLKLEPAFRAESEHKTWWAQLSSRLGYATFDLAFAIFTRTGNPEGVRSYYFYARDHFIDALKLFREGGSSSPGEALSEVCRLLPGNVRRNWSIDIQWKNMEEQPNVDVMLRSDIITARESLRGHLDEFYKLSEHNIDTSKLSPFHVPIRLELGKGLIAEDTSIERWVLFTRYIPEMKQCILDELGVKLPGLRVRDNKSLSSGGYNFLLDEAQVASGDVYLDMRYCPVAPETLRSLGIAEDALVDIPNPVTGEPGCWVQREFWDLVLQHALELWEEPLLFVIYHLGAVLRTNLTKFVGVQEVVNLLTEWEQSEEAASLIAAALPDDDARYRFVQVLRALVKEQVPIVSWKDILETSRDVGLAEGKVTEAVHAIRRRLQSSGVATSGQ